jgi:hypothetical protein
MFKNCAMFGLLVTEEHLELYRERLVAENRDADDQVRDLRPRDADARGRSSAP